MSQAGWLSHYFDILRIARISIVQDRQVASPDVVREQFKKIKPFEKIPVEKRGWTR